MRKPTEGTVLIVNSIHDTQKRAYRHEVREVSEETATEQLSKSEANRNHYWKGARYATDLEFEEFYGISKEDENKSQSIEEEISQEEKPKRVRKPREEVTNA